MAKKKARFTYRERDVLNGNVIPEKKSPHLNYKDDDTGRWGDYDHDFKEENPHRRVMEMEFLLNMIQYGQGVRKLYASLLAAAIINDYKRTDQGVYPGALREAGVEIQMKQRPITSKQKGKVS